MSIAIPNFENIKITGGINNSSIYKSYQKCIINDNSILPSNGKTPTIWSVQRAKYGEKYNEGDCVWVNTENPRDFVKNNENAMYEYVNERIPGKIRTLSGDYSALIDFYVDVINGNTEIESPYYLGVITDPVQIRISKIDNNETKPDDDSCWYDFWERNKDEKNRQIIENECSSIAYEKLDLHMDDYHMEENENDINNYLKVDLSNVKYKQEYKTHYYFENSKGFDYVKLTIQKDLGNGHHRWFRLWNSGMLEHGGIIDTANKYEKDSLEYENLCYKVALNWDHEHDTAPVYDYEIGGLNSFYDVDTSFKFSSDTTKTTRINKSGTLYLKYRYNIQVTPIFRESTNPFTEENNTEINTICNSSFCFQLNPNIRYYSYYTSGMTYSNTRRY